MATRKIWLLKLILPFRYGRWFTGVLLLLLLLPLFYIGDGETDARKTPALFFSLIVAYIVPVFSFITAKSQEALTQLRPQLDLDDLEFEHRQSRLDSVSPRLAVVILAGALFAGSAHLSFIHGSVAGAVDEMLNSISGFMTVVGTLLVWVTMATVIVMLIRQTVLFGRLGADNIQLSLFDTRRLSPFARVSIFSSLAIIGSLALFPLIGFESGLNLAESLPGVIAILMPLIVMFIIPVWPVHRRLLVMKEQELSSVSDRINACVEGEDGAMLESGRFEKLSPLLQYRREVAQMSTWPFTMGNMTTFAFYLIIPPLTWAGAALIENLVDALL